MYFDNVLIQIYRGTFSVCRIKHTVPVGKGGYAQGGKIICLDGYKTLYVIPSGKNVTINGNGHTIYITDDTEGNDRDMTLFKVSSSATLTLNNVNIVVCKLVADGTYTDNANIIDADLYSVVNVNNCTIDGSENEITRGYLARIAPTATFTATSTTFRNWVMDYGYDAPIVNKGLLTLKGCTFDNENSNYGSNSSSAGAIYQYGTTTYEDGGNSYSYKARMYISEGTEFLGCQGYNAGAIFIADGGLENYITDTTFSDCVSENNGGALTVGVTDNGTHIYGNVTIEDCIAVCDGARSTAQICG